MLARERSWGGPWPGADEGADRHRAADTHRGGDQRALDARGGRGGGRLTPPADLALRRDGDVPVATINGDVDVANAQELRKSLLEEVGDDAPGLVVDLSSTTYLDSAGVHAMFDLARKLQAQQQQLHVVVPLGAAIRRVLVLTNVSAVAPMHGKVEDAVHQLAR